MSSILLADDKTSFGIADSNISVLQSLCNNGNVAQELVEDIALVSISVTDPTQCGC